MPQNRRQIPRSGGAGCPGLSGRVKSVRVAESPRYAHNSSTPHRIGLIQRYLRVFGASSIKALLADREFIGDEWLSYLVESNVPFVIRLREDMHIETEDGRRFQFRSLLRKQRKGQWTGWLPGMARTPENPLRFEGRKIKGGELVLVVTNIPAPSNALRLYRKRWRIECLFADAKTRGFRACRVKLNSPDRLNALCFANAASTCLVNT